MVLLPFLLLLHLVGLAAFVGAAFAQQRFMSLSAKAGLATALRDEYERLAASILTKVEVPALFAQVFTGVVVIVLQPYLLQQHWLHAKLTAVVLLLVVSHLEMFNARRLVRARAARGDAAADEIAARKKRHALLGAVSTVLIVAVLVLATVLRGVM
ncbi:MAG TPA: DUF2269 family protein [Polyangiaceae bacterium]|jgi:uncharacterized membrane protein